MYRPSVLVITLAILVSACSQADTSQAETEAAPPSSLASVDIPQECIGHPLLAAMPEAKPLQGKPLTQIQCVTWAITMTWGDSDNGTQIILNDNQAPAGGLPETISNAARELDYQMARDAISTNKMIRETALSVPASLAALGGADFLSPIKETPEGMKYVIEVSPKDAGGHAGSVRGLIRDRYSVSIRIEHDNIVGAAAAEAAYAPWLAALRLSNLP